MTHQHFSVAFGCPIIFFNLDRLLVFQPDFPSLTSCDSLTQLLLKLKSFSVILLRNIKKVMYKQNKIKYQFLETLETFLRVWSWSMFIDLLFEFSTIYEWSNCDILWSCSLLLKAQKNVWKKKTIFHHYYALLRSCELFIWKLFETQKEILKEALGSISQAFWE